MATPSIGEVQRQSYLGNTRKGYGFVVFDGHKPACTFTFKTREEADEAHAVMSEIVSKAVEVA